MKRPIQLKILLLTQLLLISINVKAVNPKSPFWDGILLANKTDNQITAFIDKTEQIDDLIILANINGKTIKHSVRDYGRTLTVTITEDKEASGFIMVKKLGFIVSSVKLHDIMSANKYYLSARVTIMNSMDKKSGHIFTSRKYSTIPYKQIARRSEAEDIMLASKANQGFSLKEDREPVGKKLKRSNAVYASSTTEILDEDETKLYATRGAKKMKKQSNISKFEMIIQSSLYPSYKNNKQPTREGVSLKKDAKMFDGEYYVVKDHNSWLHLEHKRKKLEYAFDGEYLFEIKENYFRIKYKDEASVTDFLKHEKIFIKPHSKKLLGIYFEDHEIIAFKSNSSYSIQMRNDNMLKIKTGEHIYTLYSDNKYLIVKENEKLLHKINKKTIKTENQFYYQH
ncbi:hypothetical protein [Flammeovirga agarivorans]|uniref:Uncharacterized protein n=1 Tax=Flammeovirga agarivorans TaxID=2726742 RepID=A0A7X8SGZ4_9BACT|nr:hypothetical protein [Flammeovirga agarivorans]NLR90054.1 hypothetical protein [Flammeovirga agarivorans]